MEKKLTSKLVYKYKFLEVYEDDIEVNNITAKRIFLKHPGGAACLPITKDNKVILIKQFRYAINDYILEVPAGKKDDNEENTHRTVKRELEEETNYSSNNITYYKTIYPSVGYSSEKLDLYIARDCYKLKFNTNQDEDENIEIVLLTKEEVKEIINKITDPKTIILLNHYLKGEPV